MVREQLTETINSIILYWKAQDIEITPALLNEIVKVERELNIKIPDDFKILYGFVNGMKNFFPNEIDKEGFLFYPIEFIEILEETIDQKKKAKNKTGFIFAEFMHKSWWYGVKLIGDNNYTIGIMPEKNKFKPITDSLLDFLSFYINDASILYDHK